MRARWVMCVVLLIGCGEDVTGHWCGRKVSKDADCVGDEVGLLLLSQDGDTVDGQACEAHEHDCHVLERGLVSGRQVAFHYSFQGGHVDATLELRGDTLEGKFFASKCKCDLRQTFYRIR